MNRLARITEIAENVKGATFVGMDTLTEVKLTGGKKNLHQGRITKHTLGSNVMLFSNDNSNGYENMVKRRLVSEGKDTEDFKLGGLAWGEKITGTPLITHKGQLYLQAIFLKAGKSSYMLDGKTIDKDEIEGLPVRKEGKQGGLDNKVVVRAYKVSSIIAIRADGQTYTL